MATVTSTLHITYSFAEFLDLAPHMFNVRLPVLLRGPHGIGKSEIIYQIAELYGLEVLELRASQINEGDLTGMPDPEGIDIEGRKATKFNPAEEIVKACVKPYILFFDELDRGILEVRQAIFQLADSRRLKGWDLHPDTLIASAVNGGLHVSAGGYQVGEMDPAELSRWCTFDIKASLDDWLEWSKPRVHNFIREFLRLHPSHFMHEEQFLPNKKYPDPRAWYRTHRVFEDANIYTQDLTSPVIQAKIFSIANAIVGVEAANGLRDHAATFKKSVKPEEVIEQGNIAATKEFGAAEHTALIEKIIARNYFNDLSKLTPTICQNIARYFVTLPSEVAMYWFRTWKASSNDPKAILTVMKHAHTVGIDIGLHVAKITTVQKT